MRRVRRKKTGTLTIFAPHLPTRRHGPAMGQLQLYVAVLFMVAVCAGQLIYPDNDAHTLLTVQPGLSSSVFFESYFYSISGSSIVVLFAVLIAAGMVITASDSLYVADDVLNRIYLAVPSVGNRPVSPTLFYEAESLIGAQW